MNQALHIHGLDPDSMLKRVPTFFEHVQQLAADIGLPLEGLIADHIALRINDHQLAVMADKAWQAHGEVISKAEVNGRPIVVMRFAQPIKHQSWAIECLELPYPALGKSYPKQDWEHIEFVVPSIQTEPAEYLSEILSRFPSLASQWSQLEVKGIKTKLSRPKGEGERLSNPTIAFKRDGVCIKLHPYSLSTIIASEQS